MYSIAAEIQVQAPCLTTRLQDDGLRLASRPSAIAPAHEPR